MDGADEGDHINCGQLPSGVNRVVASPAWIRRWADVVVGDQDALFAPMWRDALDSSTIPGAEALAGTVGLCVGAGLRDQQDGHSDHLERVPDAQRARRIVTLSEAFAQGDTTPPPPRLSAR